MYSIIDIETTGGSPKVEKITEIAIFVHDGKKVVNEFVTLINPEKNIPYYITSLTGIDNSMVANAPKFYEVARKIVTLTENTTFVAHNANFDYGFVKSEFLQLGYNYQRDMLCTVKLSRKLIPGKRSYSLGNLCGDLGICINDRHRAAGDALATVKLFELLLDIKRKSLYSR
jgi:DNA polymerase III subunit epsilon